MKVFSKYYFFFILGYLFFCHLNLKAQEQQQIDSIKKINSTTKNKKELVENINKLAYLFGGINLDSSLFYSNKARVIAKDIGFTKGLAVSYSYTARAMIEKSNIEGSIENFDKALQLFQQENDSVNILDCYRGLSYVSSYGSSQLKCLNYNLKSLVFAEKLKDTTSLSVIYNNIGAIYSKLDNYKSSLLYFKKALNLELAKANSPSYDLAVSYSNIGVLKVKNNKFKEAKTDFDNVIRLLPKLDSPYLEAYLFLALSNYYTRVEEFDVARKYIDSAIVIYNKYDYSQIKSRGYRRNAEWYFYQGLYKESIREINNFLSYSASIGVFEEFEEMYKIRSEAYSNIGLFKDAFTSLQKANTVADSLKNNRITSFLIDFEEEKLQNEIDRHTLEQSIKDKQLENESIQRKYILTTALVAILFLCFIIGVVWFYFLKVRKRNEILKQHHKIIHEQKNLLEKNVRSLKESEDKLMELNATKDKFFKIIAHDLKSPFNAILGFTKLLTENYESYNDQRKLAMLHQLETSSESTLYLLDNLLNWARSQKGDIKIKKENNNLVALLDASISPYLGSAAIKEIKVKNKVNKNVEVCVDKETIKIVFSNLCSNAIKFSEVGSEILLTSTNSETMVEICFQDHGIGMNKTIVDGLFRIEKDVKRRGTLNENGTGLGLILCQEFVEKNNGSIRVESIEGEGSKFYISLPIKCA